MKKLLGYFLQGILFVTPIAITFYIIFSTFRYLDNIIKFPYPGIGLLVIIITITLVGAIGSYLIQFPIFRYFDSKIRKMPFVKIIYVTVKDFVDAFLGQKKGFKRPVLVKLYENSEIRRLGFITDDAHHLLTNSTDYITVYIPHSFAISGQLYLMPPSYITEVKGKPTDILKYIIAGGIAKVEE
ncbi:MAG: DUF502 domain-containing protein [Flammeovirgaceae bacterium]|nr:DUF502 domain-containing protein [Flammeovirgaceae bacterium]